MTPAEYGDRLSHISTLWSVVERAHGNVSADVQLAQTQLLQCYGGAVYRYLLGALHDPHLADELFQEFCLRFLRGDFRQADPQRGRFRDLLKTALFHLIVDHQRRQRHRSVPLSEGTAEAAEGPSTLAADRDFLHSWRDELLDRAWQALARHEQDTGQLFYTVLRYRAEHPGCSSTTMAEGLAAVTGRPWTAVNLRQILHRARGRFAELLLQDVAQALESDDIDALETELADLGLLTYCRSAIERRRQRG